MFGIHWQVFDIHWQVELTKISSMWLYWKLGIYKILVYSVLGLDRFHCIPRMWCCKYTVTFPTFHEIKSQFIHINRTINDLYIKEISDISFLEYGSDIRWIEKHKKKLFLYNKYDINFEDAYYQTVHLFQASIKSTAINLRKCYVIFWSSKR